MNTIQKLNSAVITKPGDNMNIDTAQAQLELNNFVEKFNSLKADKENLISCVGTIMNLAKENDEYATLNSIKEKFNEIYNLLFDDTQSLQKDVQARIDSLRSIAGQSLSSAQEINQSLSETQNL